MRWASWASIGAPRREWSLAIRKGTVRRSNGVGKTSMGSGATWPAAMSAMSRAVRSLATAVTAQSAPRSKRIDASV